MADKALLTGINNYADISDLRGCVNDVRNIRELLIDTYGFDDRNIRTLTDSEVTRDAITDGFRWLSKDTGEDDRVVFHFSGHGSYIPSEDDDEALDELICLYDMSWTDPASYLRDDDLNQLTQLIDGPRLTVVLDCCHSGTGTRAFSRSWKPQQKANPKSRLIIEVDTHAFHPEGHRSALRINLSHPRVQELLQDNEAEIVQARRVEPPRRFRWVEGTQMKLRRIGASTGLTRTASLQSSMNHQLLAGAAENQEAADAYINGDYNGAFTYHLCKESRAQPTGTYDGIMKSAISKIANQGYPQTPQNEGPFGAEIIFGGTRPVDDAKPAAPPWNTTGPPPAVALPPTAAVETQRLQIMQQMLSVSERFLDLSERILTVPPPTAVPVIPAGRSRPGHNVIVTVHGIGNHVSGYSVPWMDALAPHLRPALPVQEVVWSHHVNQRNIRPTTRSEARVIQSTKAELEAELQVRQQKHARPDTRGLLDNMSVDDFVRYMTIRDTREKILAEFDQVVLPLLNSGARLQIISHSWGTVVAYEALRRIDDSTFAGQVEVLFTVGSALSISAVQSNLFSRVDDGRLPAHVRQIINLDARGDIVGGPIGDEFDVAREFLGLDPVGCATIPFTNIPLNPRCAHSSYFVQENTEVNRDIFARFIN